MSEGGTGEGTMISPRHQGATKRMYPHPRHRPRQACRRRCMGSTIKARAHDQFHISSQYKADRQLSSKFPTDPPHAHTLIPTSPHTNPPVMDIVAFLGSLLLRYLEIKNISGSDIVRFMFYSGFRFCAVTSCPVQSLKR